MPADYGVGFHQNQDVGPPGPVAAQRGPEETVQGVQCGARPFAFEYSDLLSEGEDFEGGVAATAKEDADDREDGEDEFPHELTLVTWRNVARRWQRLANASH